MSPITKTGRIATKIGIMALLLLVPMEGLAAANEFDLTSEQLEQNRENSETVMYGYQLDTMRRISSRSTSVVAARPG